ncbi:MAG: hypothetical protein ABSA77_12280 [Thermoguttaceae bacterium]
MNKISHLLKIVFDSPLVWGILGSVGFYGLIFHGPLNIPLVQRYFTKHPVEYMETVLFAIGLAALILKALDIAGQRSTLATSPLGPRSQAVDPAETCHALLQRLDQVPRSRQEEFFIRRLRSALEHVRSHGSAETLNDELKYLADIDASRLHTGFGLFQVLNGLGLKFDTTAVALSMSMVLMFVHFFVDRSANGLLEQVDRRVEQELSGRWQHVSSGSDGQLAAVRRMAETMIQTSERLVQRQAELWQSSMENAAARWANMAKVGGEQLQAWLAGALSDSLKIHAQHLSAAEQASIQANRQHWEKIIQTQAHGAQNLAALQASVTRQVEVIQQAVAAVGEVARLEDALNRNLSALAGAKHFEQTVMSLAAAINLLGARLAEMPAPAAIKLDGNRRAVQAA